MIYRAIGVMSGSSLDGLDVAFVSFEETGGVWRYEIRAAQTYPYTEEWLRKLQQAVTATAYDYLQAHSEYGRFIGEQINSFIEENHLQHQVQLVASHGHTVFHAPQNGFTAQLGSGADIAAVTGINAVSDLRAMDIAIGGQGAPIVPAGERLLFADYELLLNIGGIANLTFQKDSNSIAFDICPANKVLNLLSEKEGKPYDENGMMAAVGTVHDGLLEHLNQMDYYSLLYPKSLDNSFGIETLLPIIESYGHLSAADALRTYIEHIITQVVNAIKQVEKQQVITNKQLLITGGGAFNTFLVTQLQQALQPIQYTVTVPSSEVIQYKEALIMALLGLLRWREENTVLQSVTGASRSSIGGAVWMGQEA